MSKQADWLLKELPTLVAEGVISADAAAKLRAHYSSPASARGGRNWALAAFSVLGALLVGGGIILVLAYNWSTLSHYSRTVVAFAPLLVAQFLAARVIARGEEAPGRREGAATFVMLALGACMAVVSQTYHLSDDVSAFILAWMLLSLPLVYVMNATVPAMLYLIGVTSWACLARSIHANPDLFWLLAAAVAPFAWRSAAERRYAASTAWLFWAVAISVPIALGAVLDRHDHDAWPLAYSSLFAVFYLAGRLWFRDAPSMGQRPLLVVGWLALAALSLVSTYGDWYGDDFAAGDATVYALFAVGAVLLAVSIARKDYENTVFGSFPFVVLVGSVMGSGAQLLFNVYVFIAAMVTLTDGYRRNRTGRFNAGLLLLSALIACRFFDSDLGLLSRGVVFIGIGIAFIVANRFMSRRKQEEAP